MRKPRILPLQRRAVLGIPALIVAAITGFARPAQASTATAEPECAADVLGAS